MTTDDGYRFKNSDTGGNTRLTCWAKHSVCTALVCKNGNCHKPLQCGMASGKRVHFRPHNPHSGRFASSVTIPFQVVKPFHSKVGIKVPLGFKFHTKKWWLAHPQNLKWIRLPLEHVSPPEYGTPPERMPKKFWDRGTLQGDHNIMTEPFYADKTFQSWYFRASIGPMPAKHYSHAVRREAVVGCLYALEKFMSSKLPCAFPPASVLTSTQQHA